MQKARVRIKHDKCKECGLCLIYCKQDCLVPSKQINALGYHPVRYKGEGCIGCSNCALMCPEAAIEVYREDQ